MRGKQAKILSNDNLEDLLLFAETNRHPLRNKLIVLLSAKAGLRAGEIARLTWAMVTDPIGAKFWNCPTAPPRKGAVGLSHCMRIYGQLWRRGEQQPIPLAQ
jgi:hypothetical protein